MNKPKFSRYNDGVIFIYRPNGKQSNFAAKENVSDLDDMKLIVKLDYEEMAKRESDLEFAEQLDFSLSLKVKTRLFKSVDNVCKAVIDGYLYDVKYTDKTRTEMYIYLEGVKKLVIKGA